VLKKFPHLFLVLVIEGGALMAVELMGAKLVAPPLLPDCFLIFLAVEFVCCCFSPISSHFAMNRGGMKLRTVSQVALGCKEVSYRGTTLIFSGAIP
jgi:hypothetical protein